MGVGTPENLLESISRGVDMFDCVMPTRNGRNAMFFTRFGKMNLRNAGYKADFTPIDSECECVHVQKLYARIFTASVSGKRNICSTAWNDS